MSFLLSNRRDVRVHYPGAPRDSNIDDLHDKSEEYRSPGYCDGCVEEILIDENDKRMDPDWSVFVNPDSRMPGEPRSGSAINDIAAWLRSGFRRP